MNLQHCSREVWKGETWYQIMQYVWAMANLNAAHVAHDD